MRWISNKCQYKIDKETHKCIINADTRDIRVTNSDGRGKRNRMVISAYFCTSPLKSRYFFDLNPYLSLTSPLPGVKIRVKGRIFLFLLVCCPYLCTSHSDRLGSDGAKGWGKWHTKHTVRNTRDTERNSCGTIDIPLHQQTTKGKARVLKRGAKSKPIIN